MCMITKKALAQIPLVTQEKNLLWRIFIIQMLFESHYRSVCQVRFMLSNDVFYYSSKLLLPTLEKIWLEKEETGSPLLKT